MVHKVLAYITRRKNTPLLVFEHRDQAEAGIQIPAGTVEDGEAMEAALWREVLEESGLKAGQLRLVCKLAEFESQEWQTVRHVYHLAALDELPEAWAHSVRGAGDDKGLVFVYRWETLPLKIELAGSQGRWLNEITKGAK
ncbi:MAG: NUDIX domain-containing protein [Anaerolineales bacterium]|nr:NUDIX domain-containing protein [Anaerolineales bacterium]